MSRVTRAQATTASRIRGRGVSRWPLTREVLTCCVGYGAFLAYYPPGPVGAAWCLAFGGQSLSVPLARGVFFLTLILTLLVIAVGRRGACVCTRADAALSFATAAAGFVSLDLLSAWGMGDAGLFCCCALIGAAGAYPLLCSYDALLRIRQAGSAATGFAVLAGASLVAGLLTPVGAVVARGDAWGLASLLGLAALSWACIDEEARRHAASPALGAPVSGDVRPARPRGTRGDRADAYRPSARIVVTYVTFGVAWSLSYCLLAHGCAGGRGVAGLVAPACVAGIGTSVGLILLAFAFRPSRDERFGSVLRCTVVASGVCWALMAPLDGISPNGRRFVCMVVYQLLMNCALFMNVELCRGCGLRPDEVTAAHFRWLAVGVAIGTLLYEVAMATAGETGGVQLVSSFAASALFVAVLSLPSISSQAADIANEELAEPKDLRRQLGVNGRALARRAGLTEREAQILDLVVAGRSRKEIAEELGVSTNTVKNHLTSVYAKTGVRSAGELSAMIMEDRPRA